MTIQTVQFNTGFKSDSSQNRTVRPYRDADRKVSTRKRVKPLPPEGHLVDDNLKMSTKYFFKDIKYDMRSVKDGYLGTANDHKLGRLNDVGLRLGGIAIATYLASQTTNPKARLMEYVGLAAFLTSMALYPKIAINAPARIVHGYDIDKEYIDDQGRKKSVFQDGNYIPFDMYRGQKTDEDLDIIGDRMGIPRDIKNRHDVIREQMRKTAVQNNTLWMLSAGFATPLMTALLCCGIEKFIVSPGLEKSRNAKFNSQLRSILKQSSPEEIINNSAGDSVKRILSRYEGKSMPREEVDYIINLLSQDTDYVLTEGIKADVENIFAENKVFKFNEKQLSAILDKADKSMTGAQTRFISENVLPSKSDIEAMIKDIKPECDLSKGLELTSGEFAALKERINKFAESKIDTLSGTAVNHKDYIRENVTRFSDAFNIEPCMVSVNTKSGEDLVKFANIIGDFKKKSAVLDKCANFKFEHTNETILANYYEKFQKTLIKQLGISPNDYKRMSNDKEFAERILDEKFTALCKDEAKYRQTFEKLGKVLADMDTALHGSAGNSSQIADLLSATENVYNSTARNLLDNDIGSETADRLVKGCFDNKYATKEDVINVLEGIAENRLPQSDPQSLEAMNYFRAGKGSSKNLKISRIISRYQGETNSFYRVMHSLDFYKRAENPDDLIRFSSVKNADYVKNLENKTKKIMLKGSITDFITKLGIENQYEYRDLYNIGWAAESADYGATTQKGVITDTAKEALGKNGKINVAERLQMYITRFKNIIANDKTDFTRPEHILDPNISRKYLDSARTNEAKFNLVAQSPVDMVQKATGKMHADRMWLKTVGITAGVVFGVTLAAQFFFGKIKNRQNLQSTGDSSPKLKQVKDENIK